MLFSTGAVAFTAAYCQSTKKGYRVHGETKKQQPITFTCCCRPSLLLKSTESDSGHDSINNNYFLSRGRNDNDDVSTVTSSKATTSTQLLRKLRQTTLFKRRRRSGLPRTTITDRSNIQQHAINLLSRLGGRESCLVTILLLLLYRVVPSRISLHKFIAINLTRWVAASMSLKLLTLHSQITVVVDQSTPLTQHAIMDEDWFLKGEFRVNFRGDTAHDDDYLFNTNTSGYNTTAIATPSNDDSPLLRIRQVPSDGSCLFHAIGARLVHDEWLNFQSTERQQEHPPMSSVMEYSSKLRQQAVNALQGNSQRHFTIIQDETEVPITAKSLVQLAADEFGISYNEYLTSMRDESVWGGGPEIIALASELQRQVVVLEPDESEDAGSSDVCFLKVRARFGDAVSDDGNNTIYILCANQQFPEIHGRGRDDCNHFLAVFAFGSV